MTSPCKGICILDSNDDYCIGCFRTISEITDWYKLPLSEKERIMKECEEEREYIKSNVANNFDR